MHCVHDTPGGVVGGPAETGGAMGAYARGIVRVLDPEMEPLVADPRAGR